MKKVLFAFTIALAIAGTSCKKDKSGDNGGTTSCNLPSTTVPAEMRGNWASGYNSSTDIVDVYNGKYLGNAWQSGKYFSFSPDGKYAEFYLMTSAGLTSSTATKVIGTVTFDEQEGSFVFHACNGHYKGWQNGTLTVNRDATAQELATLLTRKYYYSFEESGGNLWMQIRFNPGDDFPTSFSAVD
jgi:hypothetical protein